jgi:hypothetical protein
VRVPSRKDRLDNPEYVRLARESPDPAASMSVDELAAERRRQAPDPPRAKRRKTEQPKNSLVLFCDGIAKPHEKVMLSTALRPATYPNGDPHVLAFGEWPASQELFPELGLERWRFTCPARGCPVERKISEVNLAWAVLRAIAAGNTELSISALLASHRPLQ